MKQYHINRLLKLADYLETVPQKSFSMRDWINETECGIVACAVGHACNIPSFKRAGLMMKGTYPILTSVIDKDTNKPLDGWDAVRTFFGLDDDDKKFTNDADYLFESDKYANQNPTPKTVAKRIRAFALKKQQEMESKKAS